MSCSGSSVPASCVVGADDQGRARTRRAIAIEGPQRNQPRVIVKTIGGWLSGSRLAAFASTRWDGPGRSGLAAYAPMAYAHRTA